MRSNNRNRVCHLSLTVLLILLSVCTYTIAEAVTPDSQEDLFDLSIEQLMNVEVSMVSKKEDTLFKTPAAITVLTAEDIRKSGHQSIPEVLRMVPGIHVAQINVNQWAITSRGFNGLYAEKLLVMIDGRSVYTPLYAGVYWDVQDVILEDVERIEVIKGPGGTLWGANAVNGIINIITKKAHDTQGTLFSGGLGNEEQGFASLRHGSQLAENVYYRVYAKYLNRDESVYADGSRASDSTDSLRQGFRFDWDLSANDLVTFQGDFYRGNSGQRTKITSPGVNLEVDDNVNNRGWNILSRWTRTYSDTSDLSLQFYYDRTERDELALGQSRDTFDIDFQHRFQLLDGHNFIWGLGYRYTRDATDGSYTVSFDPASRSDETVTGFVQDEITLVEDRLKFIAGTKLEKNDYTGFEFQPNVRLLWTPNDRNTLWSSFTRAVSVPSRMDSDSTVRFLEIPPFTMQFSGNDDLEAQVVYSYELGYRVKAKENLLLDIALFYNEYENLYGQEQNPTPFSLIYDDMLYGETYGTEISAHWQVHADWNVTAGYSFLVMQMHTESSSTNTTKETEFETETPQNLFHVNSQVRLQDNLEWFTSLYYVENVPNYDIPSYIRLDTGLTWRINDDMEFSLIGQNLLDRAHPEYSNESIIATEIERSLFGKLTWRF